MKRLLGILLLACAVAGAQTSPSVLAPKSAAANTAAPAPELRDPIQILRKAFDHQDANQKLLRQYTYQQHTVAKKLEKNGLTIEEDSVYDVIPMYGDTLEKKIMQNGEPLTGKEAEKEEKKANEWMEKHKNLSDSEKAKQEEKKRKEDAEDKKFFEEALQAFDFSMLPDDTISGKPAWHIKAEPRPGFQSQSKNGKLLPKLRGTLWVDKSEFQIVKMEAEVLDTISFGFSMVRIHKGSLMLFETTRVNDEIWLPQHVHVFADVRALLLIGARVDAEIAFSNYHKYVSDVKILPGVAEVKDEKPPTTPQQ